MTIKTLDDIASSANYSFMNNLNSDPESTKDGIDHDPREVFSGHFVRVIPTPIQKPQYISHSKTLFDELKFSQDLVHTEDFIKMFSGDISNLRPPMSKVGWACGYALSIFGTEYYEQCPFGTGNGYGDGRAISVLEAILNGKRWEMQLKGAGRTPYCRGADGRAVLRSSVREFLAQEHMYALGIPTSRSLSLFTSKTQTVKRPWFKDNSYSKDPELMIDEAIAISTRVASSFLRVGQIELFGRRARKNEYSQAKQELKDIILHVIQREYSDIISQNLSFEQKVIFLAKEFSEKLTSLVVNWIRVGYTQGNFNSDNCAMGGFTLDYGPFGFIDMFDPYYQPWTGGGNHFSFFNQSKAALKNFNMFCSSIHLLLNNEKEYTDELKQISSNFPIIMEDKMQKMWASKLGLEIFDKNLFEDLIQLMNETMVDYTIFFRELSSIPKSIQALTKSFYSDIKQNKNLQTRWESWLKQWHELINIKQTSENLSSQMKKINPKYILREWILVPAYKNAENGDYALLKELQDIMIKPYDEQSKEIEKKYYEKKPIELFDIAGISHISCSS